MEAQLVISSQAVDIDTIRVDEILTIGRNPDNNLVLADNLVSRNHALIRREGGDYFVVDLGSANGTFLNSQPVKIATQLNNGDEIRIGETVLQFRSQQQRREQPLQTVAGKTTARVFAPATLSVLVTDIRNYSSLSEQIPADKLSQVLADWFRTAGRCITDHGGTIEQFRGDCVMAYWLSPPGSDSNEFVVRATQTARDLLREVQPFAEQFSADYPGCSFKIGCGVHMGQAVLGSIGPDARRDFTTLGDCVNVTFRIEALCSVLKEELLVSEAVQRAVADAFTFRDLGQHTLKGKSGQHRIFALVT